MSDHPEIILIETTTSTNLAMAEMVMHRIPENYTVIRAVNQTQGKGQGTRNWISQEGKNLTLSMYINVSGLDPSALFVINKCVAISVGEFAKQYLSGGTISVKWPNDIMVEHKKLAGILIENIFLNDQIHCIAGIGINVNQEVFPAMERTPVSFRLITGQIYDLDELTLILSSILRQNISKVLSGSTDFVNKAYDDVLWKKNEMIHCSIQGNPYTGKILGVDTTGSLQFQIAHNNDILLLEHGEIQF